MSDADLHSNTRRVRITHDGRPLGFTEALDPDNPLRRVTIRNVKWYAALKAAQVKARAEAIRNRKGIVQSAQKRSATRRGVT